MHDAKEMSFVAHSLQQVAYDYYFAGKTAITAEMVSIKIKSQKCSFIIYNAGF